MCGFGVQTQNQLEANRSIYPVGCADKAVMWIESHLLLVGALALGLALPQVTPSGLLLYFPSSSCRHRRPGAAERVAIDISTSSSSVKRCVFGRGL